MQRIAAPRHGFHDGALTDAVARVSRSGKMSEDTSHDVDTRHTRIDAVTQTSNADVYGFVVSGPPPDAAARVFLIRNRKRLQSPFARSA